MFPAFSASKSQAICCGKKIFTLSGSNILSGTKSMIWRRRIPPLQVKNIHWWNKKTDHPDFICCWSITYTIAGLCPHQDISSTSLSPKVLFSLITPRPVGSLSKTISADTRQKFHANFALSEIPRLSHLATEMWPLSCIYHTGLWPNPSSPPKGLLNPHRFHCSIWVSWWGLQMP